MVKCVVCGKQYRVDGRSFHKFPLNDEQLLQKWLEQIDAGPDFHISQISRICSDHFQEHYLQIRDREVTLLPGSIPTLFETRKIMCSFCHCKKIGKSKSFHRFPISNPQLLQKWISGMKNQNFIPTKSSYLCSDHFGKDQYRLNNQRLQSRLKRNAIPTIFQLPNSSDAECSRKRDLYVPSEIPKYIKINDGSNVRVLRTLQNTEEMHTEYIDLNESIHPEPLHFIPSIAETTCKDNENYTMHTSTEAVNIQRCNAEDGYINTVTTNYREECTQTNVEISACSSTDIKDHNYALSVQTLQEKLKKTKDKLKEARKKLKVGNQKVKRIKKKMTTLKEIVCELRRRHFMSEKGLMCLESLDEPEIFEFLKRFSKNMKCNNKVSITREKYPPALRSFALTLHFYSPKAYAFVRKAFHFALPHPRIIRAWYSSIDGEPGFSSESFTTLKQTVAQYKKQGKKVIVSLMLDEIGIKKGLQYLPNGIVRGYVEYGSHSKSESLPLAKDALVVMCVALDSNWKIPIGYFFINGIDTETSAGIIKTALTLLHDIDIEVVSLTLDGPAQHFATMRLLGATFNLDAPQPYFKHPTSGKDIHVIFDACHMLKLIRNCFGDQKILLDGEGNAIKWRFIEDLYEIQEKDGLRAGNKLKRAHVMYMKSKMKVSLAAQTLSSSVADSITFLDKKLQLPQFQDSDATVRFICCIDRLFDFLNSRNPLGKRFKSPLRRENEPFWLPVVEDDIKYLTNITDIKGTPMWRTKRYVPFVGMITGVLSVIKIFYTYVKPDHSQLKYLLTYKLSQDHLELFFCAIRSCGGWCPNPTCSQFITAYKKLLVCHQLKVTNGNCEAIDNTTILNISSGRKNEIDMYNSSLFYTGYNLRTSEKYGLSGETYDLQFVHQFLKFRSYLPQNLSKFSEACIGYISGWVVKKLLNINSKINCEQCRYALFQEPVTLDDNSLSLIGTKTRNGLIFPSRSVIKIATHTEKLLRNSFNVLQGKVPSEANFWAVICSKVLGDLLQQPCSLFPGLDDHMFDTAPNEGNHIYYLTKQICQTYIKLRMFSQTKRFSEDAVGIKLRHNMTRQVIWMHQ